MSIAFPLFLSPSVGGGGREEAELAIAVDYDQKKGAFELRTYLNGAKPR